MTDKVSKRDSSYFYAFCDRLAIIWITDFPYWRFGQFMANLFVAEGDPFYWEEEDFLYHVWHFIDKYKQVSVTQLEE